MIYGYARISTKRQNLEAQIKQLENYGVNKVFSEAFTGTKINRKEFYKLLNILKKGDTIVFDSVSRMSRNEEEGTELYFKLESEGIDLVFLKEEHINTQSFREALEISIPETGNEIVDPILDGVRKALKVKAKMDIKKAFAHAQKEVDLLSKRTKDGLANAKANGKRVGAYKGDEYKTKRSVVVREKLLKHHRAFNGSMTDKEFREAFNTSQTTLFKYKKQLREEAAEAELDSNDKYIREKYGLVVKLIR